MVSTSFFCMSKSYPDVKAKNSTKVQAYLKENYKLVFKDSKILSGFKGSRYPKLGLSIEKKSQFLVFFLGEGEMADEDWSQYEDSQLSVNTSELVHQPFLANTALAVKDVLMEAGLEVKDFARFEVGEEVKE